MVSLHLRLAFRMHIFLWPTTHLLPLVALMCLHRLHHLMLLWNEHLATCCLLIEA